MKANADKTSIGSLQQGEISPPGQGPPSHSDQPLRFPVPPGLLLLPPGPLPPLPSLPLTLTHTSSLSIGTYHRQKTVVMRMNLALARMTHTPSTMMKMNQTQ